MTTPELIPIATDERLCFSCHSNVPCFNQCCQNLNQALTPYDVLRLKQQLGMTSRAFIHHYAAIYIGETTGLPVVSLRFADGGRGSCPFVTADGCQVYAARPSSCRIYPLARALHRSRLDGSIQEHYAIIKEPHCRGFEQAQTQTVQAWIVDQELEAYHRMNDPLLQLIALKNQSRPGGLSTEHEHMARMAFYDIDTLKIQALAGKLPHMDHDHLAPMPGKADDEGWLIWAMMWIGQVLFGKKIELNIGRGGSRA